MKRREFLLAVPALSAALGSQAQQAGKVYRVGMILTLSPVADMAGSRPAHPLVRGFLQEMQRLGYAEGRNFVLERRSAEGRPERYETIVTGLLQLKVDALITINVPLTLAAKKVTSTVPIIFLMAGTGDPVAAGIVSSLARPGANITGFLADAGNPLSGKRLELLKEAFPRVSRVAFIGSATEWSGAEGRSLRAAAQALGVELLFAESRDDDYGAAFEAIRRLRPGALLVGPEPAHFSNREQIAEFAARSRLPDMHAYTVSVEAGALMSFGAEGTQRQQAANYLHRILNGTRPGDLPVQQPHLFKLAVNLKTARARGLAVAPALLLRADEVIE
jgi:putative ABC transport system substrate-binding protein